MSINFDSLPDSIEGGGGQIIPKGHYYATIEKAEMKKPKAKKVIENGEEKTIQGPDYLNLMLKLKNGAGEPMGIVWDIISESNNQYAQYKLKRFVIALGIEITPALVLDLKDLVKVAPNAKMIVDVTVDEKSTPNKNQIDIFTGDVYYPMSEANKIFGDENIFVDASDAADAFNNTPTDFEHVEY